MLIDAGYEERYWYPDDGGEVWVAGYQLVDPESGRYLARDAPELAARGLHVVGVAGAGAHHAEALASDAAAPGKPLELRRDPENPHDPNAIAVHPAGGGEQMGWVPRELAAELAAELDAGRPWSASCCASSAARRATRATGSRCCWLPMSTSRSGLPQTGSGGLNGVSQRRTVGTGPGLAQPSQTPR